MRQLPYLEHLKVQNFKSFKEIDIDLNRFNTVIGANASGKSNFVQIFNFLKDMREYGLDSAISMQGGNEYLRNFELGMEHNLKINLKLTLPKGGNIKLPFRTRKQRSWYTGATWELELDLGKRSGFKIIRDMWTVAVVIHKYDDSNESPHESTGHLEITTKGNKIHYTEHLSDGNSLNLNKYPYRHDINSKKLILEHPSSFDYMFPTITEFFDYIAIYDFDPKLAKKAAPFTGKMELDADGSNLASIVRDVISDSSDRLKFSNLVADLLPFVKSVCTKNIADKSVMFTMTENFFKKHSLPSPLLSDGTINITALIIALYFQHNSMTIIEEPERNLHPSLISRVIDMMNDASSQSQVMITTHNPEIVRYAELENLLTVRRNSEGHSEMMRQANQDDVKTFLKNDMDVEDLYVQNILGA